MYQIDTPLQINAHVAPCLRDANCHNTAMLRAVQSKGSRRGKNRFRASHGESCSSVDGLIAVWLRPTEVTLSCHLWLVLEHNVYNQCNEHPLLDWQLPCFSALTTSPPLALSRLLNHTSPPLLLFSSHTLAHLLFWPSRLYNNCHCNKYNNYNK